MNTSDENCPATDDVRVNANDPEKSMTETATLKKFVPTCAMHVARDTDMGPMYAAEPAAPCGCYFDFTNTGATTCATCDDSTPCSGAGVCRLGFCEAQ